LLPPSRDWLRREAGKERPAGDRLRPAGEQREESQSLCNTSNSQPASRLSLAAGKAERVCWLLLQQLICIYSFASERMLSQGM